ncbi:MAG: hypothetical protein JWP00_1195 [Chloroflexi bacterium]|nr:hypothetical protein [Chloroflexota bacterium]
MEPFNLAVIINEPFYAGCLNLTSFGDSLLKESLDTAFKLLYHSIITNLTMQYLKMVIKRDSTLQADKSIHKYI